jgi:serine/threonine-protein kinase RsbW
MNHSFKLYCNKEKLKDVREFVKSVLSEYQVGENDINMLTLAVDEVCANLIIHNHQCNPEESIVLNINYNNGAVTFEIIDTGNSFNMLNYEEKPIRQIVREKRKGGLGIMLVKKIMDDIQISTGPSYNVCRLYKKID